MTTNTLTRIAAAALVLAGCSGSGGADSPDGTGDADGIKGGSYTYVVTVDDASFSPAILNPENDANVTLTLHNTGMKPHNFTVAMMPQANVATVMPGASATVKFETPDREGIYVYSSTEKGDLQTGQMIVQ